MPASTDAAAAFKVDFAIGLNQPPTPIPGSFDYIYLRSASLDVLQVTADGSTWSDLPVGIRIPIYGPRGARQPIIRAKGAVAVTAVIIVSIGEVNDYALTIAQTVNVASVSSTPTREQFSAPIGNNITLGNGGGVQLSAFSSATKTVELMGIRWDQTPQHAQAAAASQLIFNIQKNIGGSITQGAAASTAGNISKRRTAAQTLLGYFAASSAGPTITGGSNTNVYAMTKPVSVGFTQANISKQYDDNFSEMGMGPLLFQPGEIISVIVGLFSFSGSAALVMSGSLLFQEY